MIMKALADFFAGLKWWILLILVIFFDGLVGGAIRIGDSRKTSSKVVGWILFVSFVLSILSFAVSLPGVIAWILHVLYLVCWIADIVSVCLYRRITVFAA